MNIHEVLTLDLREDIKHVIDLEDRSETEIQHEIESYIVTEGIGRHLYNFTNQFTSNIKETGVWLSGFYGSGKSYFGKMLGYILANPVINGAPARDRFIHRIKGIPDESLIENAILKLDAINSRVVFLDIAKQNTDRGLAFTLFANFLKTIGFREDMYGYLELELFIDQKYEEFESTVKQLTGKEWRILKTMNKEVAGAMRRAFNAMGYSEKEYEDTRDLFNDRINNFSPANFRDELEKYLAYQPDETLVFVFDEASEAVSQNKFSLIDLEGVSEALSSISKKVWTIAIAQEKLDDVINNANVKRSQLTKVTDRFKTKIHLESTEVDVIIRSRLLRKKEECLPQLTDYYKANEGLVANATNLKSSFPTKTTSAEEFADYYPFHKYQFDILQKFLFSSNALVATQIAARGMIITTFDVLRKYLREMALYAFAPGFAICAEAQPAPPSSLINKYDTARKVLTHTHIPIDGEKLLKTIHLLADSEVAAPTVENLTKSYLSDITTYYDIKPHIEKALELLVEAKVLLLANSNYKITSDLEEKLLDEMKDFNVELFSRKRFLINCLKAYKLFSQVSVYHENGDAFKFGMVSDNGDELAAPGDKQLKITVYSIFNMSGDRQDFIEQIKMETQYQKELITLIPDNSDFSKIDKLIDEISRYTYIEEKYANESDPAKRQIIRDFAIIREDREKNLRLKIETAYYNASLIYMYEEHLLNPNTFKSVFSENQKKLVKNVYTKRLPAQLSESLVPKLFTSPKEQLAKLFSGDEFKFFDANGNFIGEHLKVADEVNARIKNRYVDGRTLEAELSGAPWGYAFGTVVVTLAALLRTGRLSVKYNSLTYFSHEQKTVHEAFTNATKFKSASFKAVSRSLTAAQTSQAVQLLRELEIETHTGRKVDWNINDFDLAAAGSGMAEHFVGALNTLNETVEHFDSLFPNVTNQKTVLQAYTGKVTEGNYIDKVEQLLASEENFKSSIRTILKAQKFIKKNFSRVKEYQRFIEAVAAELKKADRPDDEIRDIRESFTALYAEDMVRHDAELSRLAQKTRDRYYWLAKTAAAAMTHEYQILAGKAADAVHILNRDYPKDLNTNNLKKLHTLERYCKDRIVTDLDLEYAVACKKCGYSLSDMINYQALAPSKANELAVIQAGFIKEPPPKPAPADGDTPAVTPQNPIKVTFPAQPGVMTVGTYRSLLESQLEVLANAQPQEEIELIIETVAKDN